MGISDIFDSLDGLDVGKVKEVVETIWDDRDKLGEVVELVWSNKDRLVPVLDWVNEHGDDLLHLMRQLPDILGRAGHGLADAGESAIGAASWLIGQSDDGVGEVIEIAAKALEACWGELDDVAKLLGHIGNHVDGVSIPTVSTTHTEVLGMNVITGVDIGSRDLFDGAADQLRGGAERISGVATGLTTLAQQLRSVAVRVVDAGGDLETVGTQLMTSGSSLVAMSGGAPRTPAKPLRTTAQKKAAAKRRAATRQRSN